MKRAKNVYAYKHGYLHNILLAKDLIYWNAGDAEGETESFHLYYSEMLTYGMNGYWENTDKAISLFGSIEVPFVNVSITSRITLFHRTR